MICYRIRRHRPADKVATLLTLVSGLAVLFLAVENSAACDQPEPAPAGDESPAFVAETNEPDDEPAEPVDPQAYQILTDLESAGERYVTIRADMDYRVDMRQLGDSEHRTGWVAFRKGKQQDETDMFRVRFETNQPGGGARFKELIDYAFDGRYLTVAKHRIKNMTFYQVAAEGEQTRPLKLGEGPFPLPFGQRADDVVRYFEASAPRPAEPAGENPPGRHIVLVTRPEYSDLYSITRMEMWIDDAVHLPVRIVSHDKNNNVTTVILSDIKTNAELPDDTFRLRRGQFGWGWQYHTRTLDDSTGLTP